MSQNQYIVIEKLRKSRLDNIDCLRGFAMLCIIMHHTFTCNELFDGNHQNALFFLLSGIFYTKKQSIYRQLKTVATRILLPFAVFYLLFYFWQMIAYYWDYRTLSGFSWDMIFDILKINERQGYLRVNYPLWFLMSLAILQIVAYFIPPHHKPSILVIISLCIISHFNDIMSFPTPFMLNKAAYWSAFFLIGMAMGRPFIDYIQNRSKTGIVCLCACVWIILLFVELSVGDIHIVMVLKQYEILVYCILLILVFSCIRENTLKKTVLLQILKFYGINSLLIMCVHMAFVHVGMRFINKIDIVECELLKGIICTIFVAIAVVPIINIVNNKFPILVGKVK